MPPGYQLVKLQTSFVGCRLYHELSFSVNGEPFKVLNYIHRNSCDNEHPPSKHHVGINMLFAPFNPADWNTIEGKYPLPHDRTTRQSHLSPLSVVAGSEGIGRIQHVNGSQFQEGDIVTTGISGVGTMRSFLWAPITSLQVLNRGDELIKCVGGAAASTLPQLGGTALRMLVDFANEGTVIQNAGNSGVGMMVSQLANDMGRSTISLVRRGSKSENEWNELVDYMNRIGKCEIVVAEEDLMEKDTMKSFQDRLKVENLVPTLALNAVGGTSASLLAKLIDTSGTIVTYGGMSKEPIVANTPHFIFKDIKYVGYWHSRWMIEHGYEQKQEMLDYLVTKVLDGKVLCPPVIPFHLKDFQQALKIHSLQEGVRKKICFDCQEDSNNYR
jgi:mitochondrial enoyl-[acyl-carrier protein] reductase / trans-2-enoyl-CoA reductase